MAHNVNGKPAESKTKSQITSLLQTNMHRHLTENMMYLWIFTVNKRLNTVRKSLASDDFSSYCYIKKTGRLVNVSQTPTQARVRTPHNNGLVTALKTNSTADK